MKIKNLSIKELAGFIGVSTGTIAALLRHSTTALVKRYAHLSPSHLKAAVEGVAGFGKAPAAVRENQVPAGESGPVSNGTVTETGTACSVGQKSGVEVRENYGAGDPD
jgi:transcriptional regulator with XRE-family HTH domain